MSDQDIGNSTETAYDTILGVRALGKGSGLSFQSNKIIVWLRRFLSAALLCALLACGAGGPNALTGGGGGIGEVAPMAAPTQPSGAASPHVDTGDEKDLSVTLVGSYPVAVANDPQNANTDPVEVTLQGHLRCSGHPAHGCLSGRILRVLFKGENQFMEGLLTKDPESNEEGYFEFKFKIAKQDIYENAISLGGNLWQFSLAPADYNATMLREKQDCSLTGDEDCRGPHWTALFFFWSAPLPAVHVPTNIGPPITIPTI